MTRLQIQAAAICLLLAACGGGGGGDGDGGGAVPPTTIAAPTDYLFPLDSNTLRVYDTTEGTEPVVVRADGTQQVSGGVTGTLLRRKNFSSGSEGQRVYVVSETGVRQYAAGGADPIERAFDGTEIMRWSVPAGHTFVQLDSTIDSGRDYDGDGLNDRVKLRVDVTAVATESVFTTAGPFVNALHHRQVMKQTLLPSGGGTPAVLDIITDTWFAPSIGPVKMVVTQRESGSDVTNTESLAEFRVGTRSKQSGAPAVVAGMPSATVGPSTQITAQFNELMEEASFVADAFALTDSAGVPVVGTVQVDGRTARFSPAQPLQGGAYVATLRADVQDLFGNRLGAPSSWSFFVDATAPGVVSTWPPADALNVRLGEVISIMLSEAPANSSFNSAGVKLTSNGVLVPTTVQVSAGGFNITPTGGLQRGTRYVVEVKGVTDVVGNVMVDDYRFAFDTTPGRFGALERLYPIEGEPGAFADAVGDVDSDGLPDVLFTINTTNGTDGYQYSLFVRKGRTDGTLAAPERLDVGPMNRLCDLNALGIGDLNGDGRLDVAVGSVVCGVLVLNQTAAGTLEPGQYIDNPVDVLRLADLDGDGRLDMVGAGRNETVARVWRQTPGGQFVLAATLDLAGELGRDVEIGDLNGDGRPDVVVALRVANRTPHMAVFRQQGDGTFSSSQFLNVGSEFGAAGLALGDLNQDGRLDIVTTTGGNAPTWFAVLFQAADGSFSAVTRVPTLDVPWAVRLADIDRDGLLDIVVSHLGHYRVGIYLQRVDGSLAPEELYDAPYGTEPLQTLVVADIDRDGWLDLVLSGEVMRQVPLAGHGALKAEVRRTQQTRDVP